MHEPTTLAYAAGLFDGEGHVYISRYHQRTRPNPVHNLYANISNTDQAVIQFLQETFGGRITFTDHSRNRNRKPHWRVCWTWLLWCRGAADFLAMIQPYVRIKREQVRLAIAFQNNCIGRHGKRVTPDMIRARDAVKEQISGLNHGRTA